MAGMMAKQLTLASDPERVIARVAPRDDGIIPGALAAQSSISGEPRDSYVLSANCRSKPRAFHNMLHAQAAVIARLAGQAPP
jgi:hypothetical protein